MKETEKIKKRYDRISKVYDWLEQPMEWMMFEKWRQEVSESLKGKVLEIGVGTGKNIPYYPEGAEVTAIDFSGKMLARAKKKAEKTGKTVELLHMDAQDMDFADNTFDVVFTTCVFCSVPDPVQGLKEIRRVLKPGGEAIMIEHVRSEKKILGKLMDLLNPIPRTNLRGQHQSPDRGECKEGRVYRCSGEESDRGHRQENPHEKSLSSRRLAWDEIPFHSVLRWR